MTTIGYTCFLDVGSSGPHVCIIIFNKYTNKILNIIFSQKERVTFQQNMESGIVPGDTVVAAIDAINKLVLSAKEVCPSLCVSDIKAVATAWARAAKNINTVLDEIKKGTGITINVITQEIEGIIGYQAALIAIEMKKYHDILAKNIVTIDIGGGSAQLTYNGGHKVDEIAISSVIFANLVIDKIKNGDISTLVIDKIKNGDISAKNSHPYPLSKNDVEKAVILAKEVIMAGMSKDAMFNDDGFAFVGIGALFSSALKYINTVNNSNSVSICKHELINAIDQLINHDLEDIAKVLKIEEVADARNRYTSMIMVQGFMDVLETDVVHIVDTVNVIGFHNC